MRAPVLLVLLAIAAYAPPAINAPLRIVIVRHTETTWNHDHRLEGWSDPPLSPLGRMQAQQLAARLRNESFDAVYASTLQRSMDTARIIAPRATVVPLADLRERNFGMFEGSAETDPSYVRRVGLEGDSLGGGETHAEFNARVQRALKFIESQHPSGNVLVVGHFGTNHLVMRYLLHLSPEAADRIEETPGDVYAIEIASHEKPRLEKLK